MPTGEKLLLLDTATLYFRAFYGIPRSVSAPDGTAVNAVRGLLDMLARLVGDHRPDRMVACWDDDWRPQFRVDALPSYKAHRVAEDGGEEMPQELAAQVPIIVDVLEAFGIARVGAPGFEADDVIATLVERETRRSAGRAATVDIVTGDRDLFQLVDDDAGVVVLYTARGLGNLERVDEARLRERYGVASGAAYADLAVLRGDPSDGLPGVPGIGERTAATLLERHGDLAGVLAAADAGGLSATQRARIAAARDYLRLAPGVVRVARDAPVAEVDNRLPDTPADPAGVSRLAERWGLGGPAARLVTTLTEVGADR